MSAPLEGIQVIEIASYVAAPAAGALLADFGADVVKVEVPEGEVIRHTRPRINGFKSRFEGSPQFEMDNRGKRSLTLDLRDEASREALRRVVDGTDVVLTNMLPGRRKKYGIDSDTLMRRNPRLIFAALSGYGGKGDEADVPAFDYAAAWARTGMMDDRRSTSRCCRRASTCWATTSPRSSPPERRRRFTTARLHGTRSGTTTAPATTAGSCS
jgi:crotonobetainyl-CoA:carnitine CoA-transferase CaiB-like acyl-CoA transferase